MRPLQQTYNMKQGEVSGEDVQTTLKVLTEFSFPDERQVKTFSFPVSRKCTVQITFSHVPDIDEWDALLAHVAFYKTWYKDDVPTQPTAEFVVSEILKAIAARDRANPAAPPSPSPA